MNVLRHNWYWVLLILLVVDVGFSFIQHNRAVLDGDIATIVLPARSYQQVLLDPFGLSAALQQEVYVAPNRFFAHGLMSGYYKTVPLLLQAFVSPIESVYLATALLKTLVQILLIVIMSAYITGSANIFRKQPLLAAVLVTPLFQAFGYHGQMGIIDKAVTYTVFYALPLGLLLLYFLPFYRAAITRRPVKLNLWAVLLLAALAVILTFNGPLVPAVVMLVCPAMLLYLAWRYARQKPEYNWWQRVQYVYESASKPMLVSYVWFIVLCSYSLYIGRYNIENLTNTLPLGERYARLPSGIFHQLTQKIGLLLLIGMLLVNAWLIKKQAMPAEAKMLVRLLKWAGLFAAVYVLLLPLGGYRDYRPNILRRDTIMPILLILVCLYGATSYQLLRHLQPNFKKWYAIATLAFAGIYTFSDKSLKPENACEKAALMTIATSPHDTVPVPCAVMRWEKITSPDKSTTQADMLREWGVVRKRKLYYEP